MKKVIILSVQPQWLHKILTGKKTIEIRKSMPKCDYPIEVYLYCTKGRNDLRVFNESVCKKFNIPRTRLYTSSEQKGYTRFIVDESQSVNGKIVAKFTLNKVKKINNYGSYFEIVHENFVYTDAIGNRSCLDFNDMKKYLNNGNGYAWHIENLEIFDKPMELREFKYECLKGEKNRCYGCDFYYFNQNESVGTEEECLCDCMPRLIRPPQSWGYAYKEE